MLGHSIRPFSDQLYNQVVTAVLNSILNTTIGIASILVFLGLVSMSKKYRKKLGIDVDTAERWVIDGNAFLGSGRYDKAIKSYEKATKIDSSHFPAWFNKGIAPLC